MKKGIRWTEADLLKITKGRAHPSVKTQLEHKAAKVNLRSTILPPILETTNLASLTEKPGINEKRKEARKSRVARVIESIKTARLHGSFVLGKSIELHFEGAMMLSPNELYALTPFERIRYKKTWHEVVQWALLVITGSPRSFKVLDCFELKLHRVSRQLCDTDALPGYCKAPIDGLKHAGIIKDDNPKFFKRISAMTQEHGAPKLMLSVAQIADPDIATAPHHSDAEK
jgi:hypothetical protein